MQAERLGPLRVRRVVKPGLTSEKEGDKPAAAARDEAPMVLVLAHGFGAPGDDLVGLASAIDAPPGTVMVFPEALHGLRELTGQAGFGDARAWWMIDFARLELALASGQARDLSGEVPEGLAEARAAFSEMLDALAKEEPAARLVLGGFSQGSMLAVDVALRQPERKIDGLVILSGTLLAEREWTPLMGAHQGADGARRTPVFQSHGRSDAILPFAAAERLRDSLSGAGFDVTFDPFAGPHTIPPRTMQALSAWLRARA
ncbi:MAG: phospholipase [Labilithrix sp.]|nr:phospholipase [Labilithrix sp.]